MSLKLEEFDRGVEYWRRSTNWPPDFHNLDYVQMAASSPNGQFNLAWWVPFLKRLNDWAATRPRSHAFLTERVTARLGALGGSWNLCVAPFIHDDIVSVKWSDIEPFTSLVSEIKDVDSPVFTSKFCHFLLPKVFPVTDNEAMGLPRATYKRHFELVQTEWTGTSHQIQVQLQSAMVIAIGAAPAAQFPMINKIAELCLIGRIH